jgi:hypothetical protein
MAFIINQIYGFSNKSKGRISRFTSINELKRNLISNIIIILASTIQILQDLIFLVLTFETCIERC